MTKARWASVWHQLDEVFKQNPESVLEIGPGPGLLRNIASSVDLNFKTIDLDPDLKPDYIGSADALPLPDNSFDVVCAFQVLEHMPFDTSMKALQEMCRVAKRSTIISLPEVGSCWPSTISLPYVRKIQFIIKNPFKKPSKHVFDGEHYWEIGKQGYDFPRVMKSIKFHAQKNCKISTYRVYENPYHRFFILNFCS